MSSHMVDQVT